MERKQPELAVEELHAQISLIIIDEIHLLGTDSGPVLEVIVSRMNYISSQLDTKVQIVGLSTALAT